jgi:4'-phosphopantetheinyl transferase
MSIAEPYEIPSPAPEASLWWCSLKLSAVDRDLPQRWLSDAERSRMQRFGNDALRSRYLAGRASLRKLLARSLEVEPDAVPIVRGPRGRPQLAGPTDIDFNVSHTADAALIGIVRGLRIGVDIERADRVINTVGIARKFMTERERAVPALNDAEAARRHVLRLWTCKEAMSKATGDALSAPFAQIDVELEPRLRLAGGPAPYRPGDWRLDVIEAPDGFLGTLALWRARNASPESPG